MAAFRTCAGNAPADAPSYGDVVGLGLVSDGGGTYLQTTIDTRKPSFRLVSRVLDDATVAQDGWSSRRVLSAQQWVLRFVTEQGADSAVADAPGATSPLWHEFVSQIAPRYVDPGSLDELTQADSAPVFRDSACPLMIEDGHPRLESEVVHLRKISSDARRDDPELLFTGLSIVAYLQLSEPLGLVDRRYVARGDQRPCCIRPCGESFTGVSSSG